MTVNSTTLLNSSKSDKVSISPSVCIPAPPAMSTLVPSSVNTSFLLCLHLMWDELSIMLLL